MGRERDTKFGVWAGHRVAIDAYTKRQSTVETATYGPEFVAARTAVDQIIDIHTTL